MSCKRTDCVDLSLLWIPEIWMFAQLTQCCSVMIRRLPPKSTVTSVVLNVLSSRLYRKSQMFKQYADSLVSDGTPEMQSLLWGEKNTLAGELGLVFPCLSWSRREVWMAYPTSSRTHSVHGPADRSSQCDGIHELPMCRQKLPLASFWKGHRSRNCLWHLGVLLLIVWCYIVRLLLGQMGGIVTLVWQMFCRRTLFFCFSWSCSEAVEIFAIKPQRKQHLADVTSTMPMTCSDLREVVWALSCFTTGSHLISFILKPNLLWYRNEIWIHFCIQFFHISRLQFCLSVIKEWSITGSLTGRKHWNADLFKSVVNRTPVSQHLW